MSSPGIMQRARRSSRGTRLRRDEVADQEEEEQPSEEEGAPRRRRAGKAPVQEAPDDEDYEPEEDELQGGAQLAGRRRALPGDAEAGPSSAKRGRRGQQPAATVKQEPGGAGAGRSRNAAAAGAADDGPIRVRNADIRELDERIAEYRRVRDHNAEKAEGKAPKMAMEQASRAVVRHMLFAHSEKPGVPVKRAEVSQVVTQRLPNVKSKAAVANYVISHAQHYLIESMGLEMQSMAKATLRGRDGAPSTEEGSQQYVLRSVVPKQLRAAFVLDPVQAAQRGLLMVVLALLQLAGGKLEEAELLTQLGELGVAADQPHPVFGSIEAQLKNFCARRYIQQDKQAGAEGDVMLYRFAEQAVGPDAEIGEQAIAKFIDDQFAALPGAATDA